MQSVMRASIQRVGLCAILPGALWAGIGGGPLPVDIIERQADVIVVATIEDVTAETKVAVQLRLRIASTIKGQVAVSVLTAELTPSPLMSSNARSPQDLVSKSVIGAPGIWFLKESNGTFQVLPLVAGEFIPEEAFLRLRSSEVPVPATVIPGLAASGDRTHQLVLAALVDAYLSTPNPGTLRDIMVASLNSEHLEDSLATAKVLLASDSPDHQILALWAMLRLAPDNALRLLAEKAPALQSHRVFPILSFVLSTEYKPNGEASIAPLRQLAAALRTSGVNFDAPVAAALRKIGTKAVVPAMVELLDSQDPTAQLHAARFLSEYALFADANGNIPASSGPGRVAGPWGTDVTQAHMPSRDSIMTAQDYAAFWKRWWAENKTKLGFPGL